MLHHIQWEFLLSTKLSNSLLQIILVAYEGYVAPSLFNTKLDLEFLISKANILL